MAIIRADMAMALVAMLIFFTLALVLMDRNVAISIIAGALTGLLEGTLMFPLENIKVQQQLDGTGMLAAIKRTSRYHGLRGFYRGLTPVLMGAVPTQAIRWGTYEAYCSIADCTDLTHVGIAAVMSGIVNSLVTGVPVETLKISMIHAGVASAKRRAAAVNAVPPAMLPPCLAQGPPMLTGLTAPEVRLSTDSSTDLIVVASPLLPGQFSVKIPSSPPPPPANDRCEISKFPHHNSSITTDILHNRQTLPLAAAAIGENGAVEDKLNAPLPLLSYRGWVPTVGKKVINQAIRFPVHSWALRFLCRAVVDAEASTVSCRHNHPVLNFVAGSLAGVSSIIVTQPLDVAKTRMQGLHGGHYHNTLHCLRCLAADEGVAAFMQGLGIRALRTSIGAGLSFALFPWVQTMVTSFWGVGDIPSV